MHSSEPSTVVFPFQSKNKMPSPCDCCDGRCQYCTSMGYTWPNVTRITGQSKNNVRKHMLLHPCCKKTSKAEVQHPMLSRPLIVDALPLDLQARILVRIHFQDLLNLYSKSRYLFKYLLRNTVGRRTS